MKKEQRLDHLKKKKRWQKGGLVLGLAACLLATTCSVVYGQYRKSHFGFNQKIAGRNVSLMTIDTAYQELAYFNKEVLVTVATEKGDVTFATASPYKVSKEWLQKELTSGKIELKKNTAFAQELEKNIRAQDFHESPGKNAFLSYKEEGATIVPEVPSTKIDKEKLTAAIKKVLEQSLDSVHVKASLFYIPVKITKDNAELQEKLKKVTRLIDKKITLAINGTDYLIPRKVLASFVDKNGKLKKNAVYDWVATSLNKQFATIEQSVHWRNPDDNKTYEYSNNGTYGWDINFPSTEKQIVSFLTSDKVEGRLSVQIDGNKDQNPRDIQDYVYINLLKQTMSIYKENKKLLETRIISGKNNKGTATVPGFHTIGYKDRNATLKGTELNGKKYAVPVSYWIPLISKGTIYTGIGIHDSNNKDLGFQNVDAWQTFLGSNGCINTPPGTMPSVWQYTTVGMAVIVRGDLYANSPGEYDKPVEFGKLLS